MLVLVVLASLAARRIPGIEWLQVVGPSQQAVRGVHSCHRKGPHPLPLSLQGPGLQTRRLAAAATLKQPNTVSVP